MNQKPEQQLSSHICSYILNFFLLETSEVESGK